MLTGFRTIIVGLAIAVGPVALNYLAGIDWKVYVPADWAPIVTGAIMIAMRLVTTGPVIKG